MKEHLTMSHPQGVPTDRLPETHCIRMGTFISRTAHQQAARR